MISEETELNLTESFPFEFSDLRGVQWRVNLEILPSSSSIEQLRRVTANSRRSYAGLRKRLLIDPFITKDEHKSLDLSVDNPLSQNPKSKWGQFFRNAELEKTVDQDLLRLYPESGSYFQTAGCQAMLRRILLLWCLKHPEYGYNQGMHELLAPLIYVLHADVDRLSEVRKFHDDYFADRFDGIYPEIRLDKRCQENLSLSRKFTDLDPNTRTIILLSDPYGAEGELGVLLSEKFMEHDAYCMFDALMSGFHGAIAMADFYSRSPVIGSQSGLPIIEASSALYHLLSYVDVSLYNHLIDIGVEPQFFALRWLRLLFEREFSLEKLLVIWDEIFASPNTKLEGENNEEGYSQFRFQFLRSPRGAFISSMAVSMILHLRSSILATEYATLCLQRLLNFPEDVDVNKLIDRAKTLQVLVINNQGLALSSGSLSPRTPLNLLAGSYWEEKWRVMHEGEELKQDHTGNNSILLEGGRHCLDRSQSETITMKLRNKDKRPLRRNLLNEFSFEVGSSIRIPEKLPCSASDANVNVEDSVDDSILGQCLPRSNLDSDKEENSSSISISSPHEMDGHDGLFDSPDSFVSVCECQTLDEEECSSIGTNGPTETMPIRTEESKSKSLESKELKTLSSKFQWFWKFGSSTRAESNNRKEPDPVSNDPNVIPNSTSMSSRSDKNVMATLRSLGQSMLDNIEVIESVFQQHHQASTDSLDLSTNIIVRGKGEDRAVEALKELRRLSNILSEMQR